MFGTKLYRLRKMLNLTQLEVANILQINRSTYSYYESGRIEPRYAILLALARLFGVPVDFLIDDDIGIDDIDIILFARKCYKDWNMDLEQWNLRKGIK